MKQTKQSIKKVFRTMSQQIVMEARTEISLNLAVMQRNIDTNRKKPFLQDNNFDKS